MINEREDASDLHEIGDQNHHAKEETSRHKSEWAPTFRKKKEGKKGLAEERMRKLISNTTFRMLRPSGHVAQAVKCQGIMDSPAFGKSDRKERGTSLKKGGLRKGAHDYPIRYAR